MHSYGFVHGKNTIAQMNKLGGTISMHTACINTICMHIAYERREYLPICDFGYSLNSCIYWDKKKTHSRTDIWNNMIHNCVGECVCFCKFWCDCCCRLRLLMFALSLRRVQKLNICGCVDCYRLSKTDSAFRRISRKWPMPIPCTWAIVCVYAFVIIVLRKVREVLINFLQINFSRLNGLFVQYMHNKRIPIQLRELSGHALICGRGERVHTQ